MEAKCFVLLIKYDEYVCACVCVSRSQVFNAFLETLLQMSRIAISNALGKVRAAITKLQFVNLLSRAVFHINAYINYVSMCVCVCCPPVAVSSSEQSCPFRYSIAVMRV